MIKFILIAGIFINPIHIVSLKQLKNRCAISLSTEGYMHYPNIQSDEKCEDLIKRINQ